VPTPRKRADERTGHTPSRPDWGTLVAPDTVEVPDADEAWPEAIVERWAAFWATPESTMVSAAKLPGLRRLFDYYADAEVLAVAARKDVMTRGSKGQWRINPAREALDRVNARALELEREYGLTPLAQLRLGATYAQGAAAAALGRQLSLLELDAVDDDPRTLALDAAAT
jgi:hypothetical protein